MFLTESFIKTISQKPRKRMFNYYWCQGCVHHEVVSAGSTSSNLLSKYFLPSDAHLSWSCLVIVISRDKTKHAAAGCSRHDRSWHWASELCQAAAVMRHHDRYLCHWASEHCSSANNNAATAMSIQFTKACAIIVIIHEMPLLSLLYGFIWTPNKQTPWLSLHN